jgi:hypothetical protein
MSYDNPDNYPEIDFCSQCRDHTVFEYDPDTEEWRSVCCDAYPMPVDVADDFYDDLTELDTDDMPNSTDDMPSSEEPNDEGELWI